MMTDISGTRYAGTFSAFRDIYRSEGLKGMWRGTGPTCSRAAVGAMTELPVYDEIKTRLLAQGNFDDGFQLHAVSALCAGLVSTFAMNPFDVAKSRVRFSPDTATVYIYNIQIARAAKVFQGSVLTASSRGLYPAFCNPIDDESNAWRPSVLWDGRLLDQDCPQ
jgi:hypothetical protein